MDQRWIHRRGEIFSLYVCGTQPKKLGTLYGDRRFFAQSLHHKDETQKQPRRAVRIDVAGIRSIHDSHHQKRRGDLRKNQIGRNPILKLFPRRTERNNEQGDDQQSRADPHFTAHFQKNIVWPVVEGGIRRVETEALNAYTEQRMLLQQSPPVSQQLRAKKQERLYTLAVHQGAEVLIRGLRNVNERNGNDAER